MALRITAMVLVGLVVIITTRPEQFSYGLRTLGVPPVVAQTIALAFYLLPLFVTTALVVRQAQQARGLELQRLPLWRRFVRAAAVVGPVTGYALRRADDLTRALELAGLGRASPTYLHARPVRASELALLAGLAALVALCIYGRLQGYGELLPRL
jgi:energy-coupling factor transport system permease protein